MQYRIISLRVKNFKCFDNKKYYEFQINYERNPVILSGPNGFGKTTFFDAIELILSRNITRLDKGIENKNKNLGKNILLNEAEQDGYIILTLKNEQQKILTLFARILNKNHKIVVEDSVEYGKIEKYLMTEELDDFLKTYNEWKTGIDNQILKYRSDNFNVYYYVSQAESVHFLKRTISDRKNAMNVLLNTKIIDEKKESIIQLIGKKKGIGGALINDEISNVEQELEKKKIEYNHLNISSDKYKNENIKYITLGLYEKNKELYFWDNGNVINFDTESIEKRIFIIDGIISFLENEEDYINYKNNQEILKIIKSKAIEDYVNYREFVIDGEVSINLIKKKLKEMDYVLQICNKSNFFRQEILDVDFYKEQDINDLKRLIPQLKEYDFSLLKNIIDEILSLKKTLSANQKIINKLTNARQLLKNAKNEYDVKNARCPYCNTKFKDSKLLDNGFEDVEKLIKNEKGIAGERITEKEKQLTNIIEPVKKTINMYLDGGNIDDKELLNKKIALMNFFNDTGRVINVERVAKYITNTELVYDMNNETLIMEIKRILSGLEKQIKNEQFEILYSRYQYDKIFDLYVENLKDIQKNILIESLKNNREYLKNKIYEKEKTELHKIEESIRQLIIRREKIKKLREKLNKLVKIYDKALDNYKNMTLEKLRIPLLIYTGKILQDYQNGLGVFVSKDEMRFVSNGDAKHDILNTFSSGQLSGFVLAFLFAMNKQYIKASSDEIGFILIDDPVQTMDDVNISSLIEVLRNDFSNKQIILSTHEIDKENYILYKFYKYGQLGQSFNVKEELYN